VIKIGESRDDLCKYGHKLSSLLEKIVEHGNQ